MALLGRLGKGGVCVEPGKRFPGGDRHPGQSHVETAGNVVPHPAWWLASCDVFLPALTKMTKGLRGASLVMPILSEDSSFNTFDPSNCPT